MVRTVWENGDGESCLRRFNPRGPPYSISHDRYLSNAPDSDDGDRHRHSGRGYLAQEKPHDVESEHESQKSLNTRRRIPVACGRCRKRKIRCSGPQGDTGCLNCKNAGSSECQFNRVSSEEIPFRDNTSDFSFPYNQNIAREVQCRQLPASAYGSSYPSATMPLNISLAYRPHPWVNDGYQNKSDCYISTYATEFGDDSVDYGLPSAQYPLMGQLQMGMTTSYGASSPPRGWNNSSSPPVQIKDPNDSMYFHPGATQSSHGLPYQAHYGVRHSVSAESSNFSFQNMASSLPTASIMATSNDRVLPIPANRANSTSNAALVNLATSADGLPYSVPSMRSTSTVHPQSSASMPYLPLSSSPDSAPSYCTNGLSSQSQEHLFAPNNTEDWAPKQLQTEAQTLRSQDSSSDLYYLATSDNARKCSTSGQSSVSGTLANGQIYHIPYSQQDHLISRKPSMDAPHIASHRHSNASLRAA